MKSETVLVTGAAGFIGSRLCEQLAHDGFEVIAVDCFLPDLYSSDIKIQRAHQLRKIEKLRFHELDLRFEDLSVLPREVDFVVNEAAMPGLLKSWDDLDTYLACNVSVLGRLIKYYSDSPLRKFVQISTSSVYGETAEGPETSTLSPTSPYGVSKLAAENLALAYWKNFNFPVTILRYFSVYGPGQRPDMGYNIFIDAALNGRPIYVHGDGEQTRTNTYVDDIVRGTIQAIHGARPGEIYNLSGSVSLSVNDSLKIISHAVGKALDVHYIAERPGDQISTRGDSSKAQNEFGFTAPTSPETGLLAQVNWQKNFQTGSK